jgi:hypothetical protein
MSTFLVRDYVMCTYVKSSTCACIKIFPRELSLHAGWRIANISKKKYGQVGNFKMQNHLAANACPALPALVNHSSWVIAMGNGIVGLLTAT